METDLSCPSAQPSCSGRRLFPGGFKCSMPETTGPCTVACGAGTEFSFMLLCKFGGKEWDACGHHCGNAFLSWARAANLINDGISSLVGLFYISSRQGNCSSSPKLNSLETFLQYFTDLSIKIKYSPWMILIIFFNRN